MTPDFKGKRALVTGAGKGVGRDLAKKLVECGATTYALSRTLSDLESLKLECPSINILHCDLSNLDESLMHVKSCGPIDILINNAAVALLEPFEQITEEAFQKSMDVNIKAPVFLSQIVTNGMIERKSGGSIVNISSQASIRAIKNHTVYSITKAALDQLTKNMALELGPHNIRVNSINPTIINTAMGAVGCDDHATGDGFINTIPLGRFVEAEEVTSLTLFLLSDESQMMSGLCIPLDGGSSSSLIYSLK